MRTFEAMIFAEVLRPLAKELGSFGELALGAAAQAVFAPERPRSR